MKYLFGFSTFIPRFLFQKSTENLNTNTESTKANNEICSLEERVQTVLTQLQLNIEANPLDDDKGITQKDYELRKLRNGISYIKIDENNGYIRSYDRNEKVSFTVKNGQEFIQLDAINGIEFPLTDDGIYKMGQLCNMINYAVVTGNNPSGSNYQNNIFEQATSVNFIEESFQELELYVKERRKNDRQLPWNNK